MKLGTKVAIRPQIRANQGIDFLKGDADQFRSRLSGEKHEGHCGRLLMYPTTAAITTTIAKIRAASRMTVAFCAERRWWDLNPLMVRFCRISR
jgi:hypothetical protein